MIFLLTDDNNGHFYILHGSKRHNIHAVEQTQRSDSDSIFRRIVSFGAGLLYIGYIGYIGVLFGAMYNVKVAIIIICK